MARRLLYLSIAGKDECVEFSTNDLPSDIAGLFAAAAEAGPTDILKLYTSTGNLVRISGALPANTPQTRYKLELAAVQDNESDVSNIGKQILDIEARLEHLEKAFVEGDGELFNFVAELKAEMAILTEKLECMAHLSWLGLYKDVSHTATFAWKKITSKDKDRPHRKSDEQNCAVIRRFQQICNVQVTQEICDYLKMPKFDNWQWDDAEMMVLLRQMFVDLGLTNKFHIDMTLMNNFLAAVYTNYNNVPFHNFNHCFMVSQMMYGLTWLCDLRSKLDDLEILTLLVAAICHDLDHPGYNNAYQINARTELALRYNDISPLENHHCATAFSLLGRQECNIFSHLTPEQFRKAREGMIKCILATDLARHNEITTNFRAIAPIFDYTNKDHRQMLMSIVIKVADVSNECRPMNVAEPWLECLLEEFFAQSDMEKLEGLPVAPFMDREKVTKPSAQIGFISFVLLPLFEALALLFPVVTHELIDPVKQSLSYYKEMQTANENRKRPTTPPQATPNDPKVNSAAADNSKTKSSHVITPPTASNNKLAVVSASKLNGKQSATSTTVAKSGTSQLNATAPQSGGSKLQVAAAAASKVSVTSQQSSKSLLTTSAVVTDDKKLSHHSTPADEALVSASAAWRHAQAASASGSNMGGGSVASGHVSSGATADEDEEDD